MRVLIFTESFLPLKTGVAKFSYELALTLRRKGVEVVVLTGNFPNMPEVPFPVERVGEVGKIFANGSFTWFIKTSPIHMYERLRGVVRRYSVNVLHNQGPLGPPYSMLVASMVAHIDPKVRRVGTFHSKRMRVGWGFKLLGRILSPLVKRHHILTAPSKSTADEMRTLLKLREVKVVPNAIDTAVFRPDLPPLDFLADGRKTALFVGRLDERKGVDTLLKAWEILSRRYLNFVANYKLVIVGNGPLREDVLKCMQRLKNILLFDDVPMGDPNFPRFYTSSDFAVFPAKGGEAFGIVILEAFASGKPAIVSNIPGYNEVATPETALFVPPNSPEHLSEALFRMFEDEDLRLNMGKRALKRAYEFSWDRVADLFLSLYR
ncbi:MAG: glycosyltransferase family 4 protein [Thermotogae bacterium]|nr:glycosyltransferase family 4 protein [Thermotogota bacterium]